MIAYESILLEVRLDALITLSIFAELVAIPFPPLCVAKFALYTANRMGPLLFLNIDGDKHFLPPS